MRGMCFAGFVMAMVGTRASLRMDRPSLNEVSARWAYERVCMGLRFCLEEVYWCVAANIEQSRAE